MEYTKNILVIDSYPKNNKLVFNFLTEMKNEHFNFHLFVGPSCPKTDFASDRKIFFGPGIKNKTGNFCFLLLLPLLYSWHLFSLLKIKHKKNIKTLICLNRNEKIIFTPLAKILKIKTVWLELPENNYKDSTAINRFYKSLAKKAEVVTFLDLTKNIFKTKILGPDCDKKIHVIHPGVKNHRERQDNLFSNLAKADHADFSRKFFSIGTVTNFTQPNQLENLFQAIKTCLPVIANPQLVIIGDGPERKNLTWAAKKMEIDSLVWFVGEQPFLGKWFDSIDIFVPVDETPALANLEAILKAMAAGLPVVGFRDHGFEDLILENKTGSLIETNNSEMLARQIIKLYQDKKLRAELGKNAREIAEKNFSLLKQTIEFKKVL